MMIKKISVLLLISLFIIAINAQNADAKKSKYPKEDRGAWGTFVVKYELTKKFSLEFDQELRYYKNYKTLEQSLTDFGANYSITDWMKAGLTYRYKSYFDEDDEDKDQYAQELHANLSFKHTVLGFGLSDRMRLQSRFLEKEDNQYFFRNKLTVEYKELAKWVSPYISAEVYHRIGAGSDNEINKARFSLGLTFEPFKDNEISIYFLRENEYNKKKIVNSNIIGLEYEISID